MPNQEGPEIQTDELLKMLVEELDGTNLFGRRMVDAEQCLNIVNELINRMPQELTTAKRVLTDRAVIIREAQLRAEDIIATAEKQYNEMVSEHTITKEAKRRASEIIGQAREEAADMREDAMLFADSILKDLERQMSSLLGEVRTNRNGLKQIDGRR